MTARRLHAAAGGIDGADIELADAVRGGRDFFLGLTSVCGGLRAVANVPYTRSSVSLPASDEDV